MHERLEGGISTARASKLLLAAGQREIGPLGTASRVLVGLVAIALPIFLFTPIDRAEAGRERGSRAAIEARSGAVS